MARGKYILAQPACDQFHGGFQRVPSLRDNKRLARQLEAPSVTCWG